MAQLCLYFQLHQPYRLQPFSVFALDQDQEYFRQTGQKELDENALIFQKVAQKSYLPMLRVLLDLTKKFKDFHVAFSCSGVFLDQAEQYCPEVIELIQRLVKTGQVELLAETYYHSLASLYSPEEFREQVALHTKKLKKLFNYTSQIFRNTELIYSNDIAAQVGQLKFKGMLTEGVDRCLHGRPRTQVFKSHSQPALPILLKHAQLSDDVAFRFSDKNWVEFPLTADKYVHWLGNYYDEEIIGLFMDFETFGEHQWADTGIFNFFEHMVEKVIHSHKHQFVTPSDLCAPFAKDPEKLDQLPVYDVPEPISWADIDRDLTAWRGNTLQDDTLRLIYSLEEKIASTKNQQLLDSWRRLQTSDHFYYMCVKWSADGDVHKYFSPYPSPFEAYNRYTAVIADLQGRLMELADSKPIL